MLLWGTTTSRTGCTVNSPAPSSSCSPSGTCAMTSCRVPFRLSCRFLKERFALSYAVTGTLLMAAHLTSSVIQPLFGYVTDRSRSLS